MAEILEGFGGTPAQAARAVALLKSLSHEGRLQILCLLVGGEMNVTQLAEALGSSPVTVSSKRNLRHVSARRAELALLQKKPCCGSWLEAPK